MRLTRYSEYGCRVCSKYCHRVRMNYLGELDVHLNRFTLNDPDLSNNDISFDGELIIENKPDGLLTYMKSSHASDATFYVYTNRPTISDRIMKLIQTYIAMEEF